eukprot:scaffold5391_cov29-Tisochrysis_lutea.AAC.4
MLDEAHATLVYGHNGGGLAEARGLADHVDIHTGNLSKAFGAHGGEQVSWRGTHAELEYTAHRCSMAESHANKALWLKRHNHHGVICPHIRAAQLSLAKCASRNLRL